MAIKLLIWWATLKVNQIPSVYCIFTAVVIKMYRTQMYVKDESEERFNSFEFFALRASHLFTSNGKHNRLANVHFTKQK